MKHEILTGVTVDPTSLLDHSILFRLVDLAEQDPESRDAMLGVMDGLEEGWNQR